MKKVIITAPAYDVVTHHFYYWVARVLSHIKDNSPNLEAVVLEKEQADPKTFSQNISKHGPEMVFFNGHGNDSQIAGHNDAVLVGVSDGSHEQLEGCIVHSLACQSGKNLGKRLIEIGARAFIGYREDFEFIYTVDNPVAQGHDDVAALFLDPAHSPMLALASGKSAKSAYNEARRRYRDNFLHAYANNMDDDILQTLTKDLRHIVLHGDEKASI